MLYNVLNILSEIWPTYAFELSGHPWKNVFGSLLSQSWIGCETSRILFAISSDASTLNEEIIKSLLNVGHINSNIYFDQSYDKTNWPK